MSLRLSDIRMRDPFVLRQAGTSYLYGTTDEHLWGGPATGFDCYRSTDFETWEGPFAAFRPPAGFWADTQFWAPEVHPYRGRFAMLATFADSTPGARPRGVGVLMADDPAGPFRPWSDGPVTPPELPCLDGTLFVDDDGTPWLVYSRGAEGTSDSDPGPADGEMWARRLSEDLRSAAGAPVLLFTASSAEWSRPLRLPPGEEPPEGLHLAKEPRFTDGPFLVRAPGSALLMLWSSFGEEGYAMGVASSASGSILGPWAQRREPLWARNGGHGMVLVDRDGAAQLVFHWPNETPDERVRVAAVAIEPDGIRLIEA